MRISSLPKHYLPSHDGRSIEKLLQRSCRVEMAPCFLVVGEPGRLVPHSPSHPHLAPIPVFKLCHPLSCEWRPVRLVGIDAITVILAASTAWTMSITGEFPETWARDQHVEGNAWNAGPYGRSDKPAMVSLA